VNIFEYKRKIADLRAEKVRQLVEVGVQNWEEYRSVRAQFKVLDEVLQLDREEEKKDKAA
jgi:hypothetical protein